jgi:hypothetical protein
MAEQNDRLVMPMKAGADLSLFRYRVVRQTTVERVCNVASNATEGFAIGTIGILDNAPASGQNASVCYAGVTKAVAAGSVALGVVLTTNGSGKVTAAASGDLAVGQALQAASAENDVISVKVNVWRLSGAV